MKKEITSYTPVIGLEIHVELKTVSKMFCGCTNDPFQAKKPNIYTCPVCLGFPGALPVPNRKAIDWTLLFALALNCEINEESKFDRKHYFYPDLPKGYQISQYDTPFGYGGYFEIADASKKKIRIRRVHLEEDTAKLLHKKVSGENLSLIDFNRSGIPLIEIVTEPDFRYSAEVKEFTKQLQKVIRFLDISDADMEKGSMRLEANISLSAETSIQDNSLPDYKVELKNINSFKFLADAIDYEISRQQSLLSKGEKVVQETRGWNAIKKTTRSQRRKEEAHDYRYFPEPDIPPIRFNKQKITELRNDLPRLPSHYMNIFEDVGISKSAAEILTSERKLAELTLGALHLTQDKKGLAHWLLHKKAHTENLSSKEIIELYMKDTVALVSDAHLLQEWATTTLQENPKETQAYLDGKEKILMYFIGQIQKKAKGKADVKKVEQILKEVLAQLRLKNVDL